MTDQIIEPTQTHPRVIQLRALLPTYGCKAAIVDLLGRIDSDHQRIGPGHPGRFEIRSAQHVAVYKFKTVEANY